MSRARPAAAAPFESAARDTLKQLRDALGLAIESIPGEPVTRPSELARRLDLDTRLAWKISKVVNARDPFLASQYLPGASGVKIFLRAASRRDVSATVLDGVRQAFKRFDELMKVHSDNRETFDAMLAGHVTDQRGRVDLEHRKSAFRAMSYIWGVQARTHLHTYLLAPSATASYFDAAILRGYIDLRWIRPNVPWRLSRFYTVDAAGEMHTSFEREPIAPPPSGGPGEADMPVMHEFSTQPLPECRRVVGGKGNVSYRLVEGSVGDTGAMTCVYGEVIRAAEPSRVQGDHTALCMTALPRTPARTLMFDVLVHRELFDAPRFRAELYGDLYGEAFEGDPAECDRLPMHETIEFLGAGAGAVRTPDVPRYPEMVQQAAERLGCRDDSFDAWRLRIEYPPVPSALRVTQPLPD